MPTKSSAVLGNVTPFGTAQNPISIPDGQFTIPPTSLPASTTSLLISMARCTSAQPTIWPNTTTTVDIELLVSFDGGLTYPSGAVFTEQGGIAIFKGQEIANTDDGMSFGDANGPLVMTHVKGTLTVAGGPCVTYGFVQASS